MANQPTMEQVLKLVSFKQYYDGSWGVKDVSGNVYGDVEGNVYGNVKGDVCGNVKGSVVGYVEGSVEGDVKGDVFGDVGGSVSGTINGKEWQYVETPAEKLRRLIEEKRDYDEILQALNEMENN